MLNKGIVINTKDEIIDWIKAKYKAIKQDPDVHLEGLVWAKFTELPPEVQEL